jgi:NAD-dependent dihydropyrimidine dehydrogenase PreA subunit
MACPYGAIYLDPETNTADKCTYCAHRIESSLMPACVVACPVEANIFGDLDDDHSNISLYIMEHRGAVQVRKPEKHTYPTHFYVGGGNQTLNPLAHQRLEGYNLFNNITHLKGHPGDPNRSILDRFTEPFTGKEELDNTSLLASEKDNSESYEQEGGH